MRSRSCAKISGDVKRSCGIVWAPCRNDSTVFWNVAMDEKCRTGATRVRPDRPTIICDPRYPHRVQRVSRSANTMPLRAVLRATMLSGLLAAAAHGQGVIAGSVVDADGRPLALAAVRASPTGGAT